MCFSPCLTVWKGGGKRLGHNVLMQFSTLGDSKMQNFETDSFNILTIHNDEISYAQYALHPLYVFYILFGCWRAGWRGSE